MAVPVPVVVRVKLVSWLLIPRPHVSVTVCEIGFRYSPKLFPLLSDADHFRTVSSSVSGTQFLLNGPRSTFSARL